MKKTARFLCSLNEKYSQKEVISFEIDVPLYNGDDPHSLDVRSRAQFAGCNSEQLGEKYRHFSGDQFWMDAVCLEPVENGNQ